MKLDLFLVGMTIVFFCVAYVINRRFPSVFTLPIFTASAMMIILLVSMNLTYESYSGARQFFSFMMGPAIVAFAVPMYSVRAIIYRYLPVVLIGMMIGLAVSVGMAFIFSLVLPLSAEMVSSLWGKNVTLPVAITIANDIEASASLTAIGVVLSGCIGAAFGNRILHFMGVKNRVARGVAMAAVAHIMGSSHSMLLNKEEGAIGLVTMAGTAILASVFIPILV